MQKLGDLDKSLKYKFDQNMSSITERVTMFEIEIGRKMKQL